MSRSPKLSASPPFPSRRTSSTVARVDSISLVTDGWAARGICHARSFRERWRGIEQVPGSGLLLETRSVHGFGMRAPVRAVAITPGMRVSAVRWLLPWRILFFPTARFILELPAWQSPPPIGSTLVIFDE